MPMSPRTLERRIRSRAQREDPANHGHPLRWFSVLPFISGTVLNRWAAVTQRAARRL